MAAFVVLRLMEERKNDYYALMLNADIIKSLYTGFNLNLRQEEIYSLLQILENLLAYGNT